MYTGNFCAKTKYNQKSSFNSSWWISAFLNNKRSNRISNMYPETSLDIFFSKGKIHYAV